MLLISELHSVPGSVTVFYFEFGSGIVNYFPNVCEKFFFFGIRINLKKIVKMILIKSRKLCFLLII